MKKRILIIVAAVLCLNAGQDAPVFSAHQKAEKPEKKQVLTSAKCEKCYIKGKINYSEILLSFENKEIPVNLEECLYTALANNLGIKIAASRKTADKWQYFNTLSDYLPDVSYSYAHSRLGGVFLFGGFSKTSKLATTSIDTGFTARWDGFTGFARFFQLSANLNKYKASGKKLDLTKDQILLLATKQYYKLLQDTANIDIFKKALEQTQSHLKINQQRYDAGVGTKFDIIRSEAEVAQAQQDLISAQNRLKLSQADLANTLGVNILTPLIPEENSVQPKTLIAENSDVSRIFETAAKNKPDIDIAKYNLKAAKSIRNSTLSQYLPTASVIGNISESGNEIRDLNQNQSIELLVTWNGGANLGLDGFTKFKSAQAQAKEAKLSLLDTKRQVEEDIVNSYWNSKSAKELIIAAEKQVAAAKESLRLSEVRLSNGVGIYTDVISAQLADTQAKTNYLNAVTNYNTAQTQLLYDMGVISAGSIIDGYVVEDISSKKSVKH